MGSSGRFDSWHVVVTGAGTGIGRAIALRLAGEGARISLLARSEGRLAETAAKIKERGGKEALALSLDVRDRAEVERRFDEAVERLGPIRGLVANSGIGGPNAPGVRPDGPSGPHDSAGPHDSRGATASAPPKEHGASTDRFDDLVATNLTGTYNCLRAAEHRLAKGPEVRHLVAISSILARIGVAGYTGYCASKAGVLGLVRALALELAPANVQVNAVCPGWVETDMALQGIAGMARAMNVGVEAARAEAMKDVPLGRMSAPEDVAGVVAWLLSDDARGVTGQGIDVNGGAWMG